MHISTVSDKQVPQSVISWGYHVVSKRREIWVFHDWREEVIAEQEGQKTSVRKVTCVLSGPPHVVHLWGHRRWYHSAVVPTAEYSLIHLYHTAADVLPLNFVSFFQLQWPYVTYGWSRKPKAINFKISLLLKCLLLKRLYNWHVSIFQLSYLFNHFWPLL